MNTPVVLPSQSSSSRSLSAARHEEDRLRYVAYVVIAMAALIVGLILGRLSGPITLHDSRIAWPSPDSILPHPRSLQP